MNTALTTFLARLDDFAAGLTGAEQLMLRSLLEDHEDTAGFSLEPPWPGARSMLSPVKIGILVDVSGGDISSGDQGSGRISSGDQGSGRIKN